MILRNIMLSTLVMLLAGCVSFDIEKSLSDTNAELETFTNGKLQLKRNEEQASEARKRVSELLDSTLSQASAVEVALLNSPAFQTLLANHWERSANAAISGSIPNPIFEFGRLSNDEELEIERVLSIGLLDLLRYPMLYRGAKVQLHVEQTRLASQVVDKITEVRHAWVRAITTQQLAAYANQIFSSAQASAALAANMQAIGNFSALSRARQQSYYADAATNLTLARHQALASREALIRLLGLDNAQAENLILPDRLPELPEAPLPAKEVTAASLQNRIDVKMAAADLTLATMQQGLKIASEITDIELAAISETVWQEGERESIDGYEIGVEIPIFSGIKQHRNRLNAKSLAASNTLDNVTRSALSFLREAYSAYRSSYDIARHYRDEVVPLQHMVSEENVLKYNGMLIGVFELLADSRVQIETVQASIEAAAQFWTADAQLRSSMVGNPSSSSIAMSSSQSADSQEGGDH